MSFSISLQNNSSPINKIGKAISTIATVSGDLKNESDVIRPEILIESDSSILSANYMTIDTFHRKYFIEEIQSVRTNLWLVKAHVDVLETYASQILSNTAVVLRQENNFDLLLNDGVFKCKQDPRIFYRKFPSGLGDFNFILITQGR